MVGKITDVLLSQTSNNDRSIALEGLIISSNQNVIENSEIFNSIIANENAKSDSNITSDITNSSSKYLR